MITFFYVQSEYYLPALNMIPHSLASPNNSIHRTVPIYNPHPFYYYTLVYTFVFVKGLFICMLRSTFSTPNNFIKSLIIMYSDLWMWQNHHNGIESLAF